MSDNYTTGATGGSNVKIAILFGAVIALLAANVYLFLQVDRLRTDLGKMGEALTNQVSAIQQSAQISTQTARRNVETLRDELETARRQAKMAAGEAKVEAQKHADSLAKQLEAEQKKQSAALKGEVAQVKQEVKQEAQATDAKIGAVNAEVGTVKSEVASTKSELDKTISELKSVKGDLGVQSGLIATNGKELAALIAKGDRNYYEFNLGKTKAPYKVGDISMLLKKADNKKNRYTIEVYADDKRVEKKDKTINEPVQFLVAKGGRTPYEIVVNEVRKDSIVGYLVTPKVTTPR